MVVINHGRWLPWQRRLLPLVSGWNQRWNKLHSSFGQYGASSSCVHADRPNCGENHVIQEKEEAKPFEDIPGPRSLPIVGTLYLYLPFIGKYSFKRLHHTGIKKLQEFGPIVRERLLANVTFLLLFDPQDIETMYAVEGRYPMRRSHIALEKYRLDHPDMYNSGGLFPTNGLAWWKLRSPAQKVLSRPQSVRSRLPIASQVSQDFVDLIASIRNPKTGLIPDFINLERRLFLELTTAGVLDVRLGCINKSNLNVINKEAEDLMIAAQESNASILGTDNGLHLWKKFNTPLYKKLMHGQNTIYRIAFKYVDAKDNELRSKSPDEIDEPKTVLEYFLLRSGLDKKDIVSIFCDTLLAGIDTGAYALSYALYYLATNPEKQQILATEAKDLLLQSGEEVTQKVLTEAKYLKAVIKESYRLRPISIGVGRILSEDAVIRGYKIPKDTVIVTQNQVTSRLPEYFHDPETFLPERWFTKDTINPFLVLPFGHGPRACIGRRMAEQNLYTALIKIVAHYKIRWQGGDLDCFSNLINEPDAPLDFTFTPRV